MKTWLALGDSYTIGESVPVADRYPVQTIEILKTKKIDFEYPEIIAKTGWTTADLLSAMNTRSLGIYEIVTLLIGVNNQYQGKSISEYEEQFIDLLEWSIQLANNNPDHVIVLSVPDYSVTPFARGRDTDLISKQINSFNLVNKKIASSYQVHYLNITDESRKAVNDPSLIADDGLHYSGKEYSIWAVMLSALLQIIV